MREDLVSYLKGRRVAVLGLGKSGVSTVHLLSRLGARIFVSDLHPSQTSLRSIKKIEHQHEFGTHSKKILNHELIIVSPGIDWNLPILQKARALKREVWGELELGYQLLQSHKIVAVTGTNGKTTTVSLLGEIFRRSGLKSLVAGNIGSPLTHFVPNKISYDVTDLEVSSYQLEGMSQFHPQVSVVLNLTNDHLKRHKTMENYSSIKERIFMNQGIKDFTVLNWDDPWCKKMAIKCPAQIIWFSKGKLNVGVGWDKIKNKIVANLCNRTFFFTPAPHLYGSHNIENSCAAIAAALVMGLTQKNIQEGLTQFKGVEHRLEEISKIKGVTYINDSKGTNVDSTLKALESFKQPLWIILGGQDKGGSYKPIRSFIQKNKKSVKGVRLIGEASQKIFTHLKGVCDIIVSGTLKKAVDDLTPRARRGDVILLSPACASFDQFKSFEDRGLQFKKLVWKIKKH